MKLTKGKLLTIISCSIIGLLAISVICINIYNERIVMKKMAENRAFIDGYMSQYSQDVCTSVEKKTTKVTNDFLTGGGAVYVPTDKDDYNAFYLEVYHMEYQGLPYDVEFMHEKRGDIRVASDGRPRLLEIINAYYGNYQLIEEVANRYNCKATLLSKYSDAGESGVLDIDRFDRGKTHFILLYVPDVSTAETLLHAIYEDVTGGYLEERKAKLVGDDIDMPRYIITNDETMYDTIASKSEDAKEYLFGYIYPCYNSAARTDSVRLDNLLSYLVDLHHPSRYEAQMINTEQYIRSDKWLLTYELEYGIAYYLGVYDLDK